MRLKRYKCNILAMVPWTDRNALRITQILVSYYFLKQIRTATNLNVSIELIISQKIIYKFRSFDQEWNGIQRILIFAFMWEQKVKEMATKKDISNHFI